MKFTSGIGFLGIVGLFMGCRTVEPAEESIAIICTAELVDGSGVVLASLEDTVAVMMPRDSVGGDPRPCRSRYEARSLTLNAKSDSVSGSPVD